MADLNWCLWRRVHGPGKTTIIWRRAVTAVFYFSIEVRQRTWISDLKIWFPLADQQKTEFFVTLKITKPCRKETKGIKSSYFVNSSTNLSFHERVPSPSTALRNTWNASGMLDILVTCVYWRHQYSRTIYIAVFTFVYIWKSFVSKDIKL